MMTVPAIITVTLNAAKDVVYVVDGYRFGEQHRSVAEVEVPGGKGVNVAKVIGALGGSVTATGLLAGTTGDFIERGLADRGIATAFVRADGESRTCFSVLDRQSRVLTEIYPPRGATIEPAHLSELAARLVTLAGSGVWVVISGSRPAAAPPDTYPRLVRQVQAVGARVIIDSNPAELTRVLPERPWGIKGNAAEIGEATGIPATTLPGARAAARALRAHGVELVGVTRGGDAAVLALGESSWSGRPPPVDAISPVGSGDAFLGALTLALARGEPPATALRWALAAGAANAAAIGAGELSADTWRELLARTDVVPLTDETSTETGIDG